MMLLAHAGITLGAATLVAGAVEGARHASSPKVSWFASLSRYVDIRILLVGALLPDIIDKPVGQYFFRDTFSNGRIFSHTLLFLVVLVAVGFFLYWRWRMVWMLTLAAGTFMHLLLDSIWQTPETLFWPFLGFGFPQAPLEDWLAELLEGLSSKPAVYLPEAVGLAVLLWFFLTLVFRRKVGTFLKYGKA